MARHHGAGITSAVGSLIIFVRKMSEPTTEMYIIQTARWIRQQFGRGGKDGHKRCRWFWDMIERKATLKRKDWKYLIKRSRQIDVVIARSIFIEQIYICLKMFGRNDIGEQGAVEGSANGRK